MIDDRLWMAKCDARKGNALDRFRFVDNHDSWIGKERTSQFENHQAAKQKYCYWNNYPKDSDEIKIDM